jgi:hypothetical protein
MICTARPTRRRTAHTALYSLAATLALCATLGGAGLAQTPPAATPPAPGAPAAVKNPAGAERADRLLKQMSSYIGSAQEFTVHADITFDHVLPSGQKVQFAAIEDVALKRPDGLYLDWVGDLGNRKFWYNGKTVTLYDPATPFYGSENAPADMDAMLAQVVGQLGFSPPLVDFFYRDPYAMVRDGIQGAIFLGTSVVNGRTCTSLAVGGKNADWQIWIEDGPQPTPCKLVITYKTLPSQPQFTAVFADWDFQPRIAASVFTPDLPPGTTKVRFLPVAPAGPR